MVRPLIALTADRSEKDSAFGLRQSTLQVMEYAEAIVHAGGRPVLMPATDEIPQDGLLEGFDGLLLTGGGDLSAEMYGEVPDETAYGVSIERDRLETALVEEAEERGLPVLAICRGMQLVNVLRGGTLIQHLAGHWQTRPSNEFDHYVAVEAESRLAAITQGTCIGVNSYHHQAVDKLGAGLVVTARSEEVIEAVEDPENDLVAVQWHPEHLYKDSPQNQALFDDLVVRAQTHQERRLAAWLITTEPS